MNAIASYRALLKNGPLTRLLVGEFASGIGNWLYLVALMVVIYKTGGAALLGVIGAARILPYVVFSIPAGMVADRFDRRLVLLTSDVARGLLMLVLAWLAAVNGSPFAMVGVAILATCFATLFYPAIGALIPSMVRDETEFGPANSAWQTLDMVAFVVGPALGGVLLALNDLALAFLVNAISFFVIAGVLWTLPSVKPKTAVAPAAAAGSEGLEAAAAAAPGASESLPAPSAPEPAHGPAPTVQEPSFAAASAEAMPEKAAPARPSLLRLPRRPLAGIFAVDATNAFVGQGVLTLIVILVSQVYRSGEASVGYLNAGIGVGGVLGAVAAGVLVLRRNLAPAVLAGAIVLGIATLLLGFTYSVEIAFVLIAVTAAASVMLDVSDTTIFQRIVPDELRGRATGVWVSGTTIFNATGSLALPLLFVAVGLTPLMVALAVILGLSGLLAVVLIGSAAVREPTAFEQQLLRAARLPIFAGLAPARLDHALRHVHAVHYHAGDVIIRQGDAADNFYILSEGHVTVTGQDSPSAPVRILRHLGPDSVFGEIGLLTNAPRTATCTADDDVLVLAMKGPDFVKLVTAGTGVAARFLDLYRTPAAEETPPALEAPAAT